MRVAVVGAGPAGLYFALLLKRDRPQAEVTVYEQNPPDATYGWGVVLSDRALAFLEAGDAETWADLAHRLQLWDEVAVVHRGQRIAVGGNAYSGIRRLDLLRVLQEHCRRRGVLLRFGARVEALQPLEGCDLVVGADGVHSAVRAERAASFRPTLDVRPNRYVWYGTRRLFPALSLIFRRHARGAFVAHCYRYGPDTSTFIVETTAATWERAGLARLSEEESRLWCQELFREELEGQPLLGNRSVWTRFVSVSNARWSDGKTVLIGDALRTVHFSIGSGTRTALEDALALHRALIDRPDLPAALAEFERSRRAEGEALLQAARRSMAWFEALDEKVEMDPLALAYDCLRRAGRFDHEELRRRDPAFVAAWERQQGREGAGG